MYPNSSIRYDTVSGHNQKLSTYSQIEISVSARNLVNRDLTSKSDPQCILFIRHGFGDKYIEIGRTEVIKDNLNPDWVKKFEIQFKFNESQLLKFELWDVDPISGNEFLGQITTELAAILAKNGGTFSQKLAHRGQRGRRFGGDILIRAEELSANKQMASISFSASNLDKKDFLGKSDPYFVVSRGNPDGTFSAVHKSEVIRNNLNPQWKPFNIRVQQLCGGDLDRNLKIECFDWDENSAHDPIGYCMTTLRRLTTGSPQQNIYELINEEKRKRKKGYSNSGVIKLNQISMTNEVTFLDYIRGGTQMHFAVAVDFTASNGDPRDSRSLHFMDQSGRPNQYEIALKSVGEVIKSYDTQGLFPSYGFGAKLPNGQVSHLFPLNNNLSYPYCKGIEEVISCYKSSLYTVALHGPTNFAPVINNTASIAGRHQDGKHYFVQLIVTDGVISDMTETLSAIVNASTLPLSIIIIGVGNADFSGMDFLDGDGTTLSSGGRRAQRDIVQFVPFNRFSSSLSDWHQNMFELSRAVLAEIPTQFIQYMQSRGFKPSAPNQGTVAGIFPEPTGATAPYAGGTAPQTGATGMFPEPTGTQSTAAPMYPSVPSSAPYPPNPGQPNPSYGQPQNAYPPATSYPGAVPAFPSGPNPDTLTNDPSFKSAPHSYPSAPNPYPGGGPNPYAAAGGNTAYPPTGTNPYPPAGGNPYPPTGGNAYPPTGGNAYPQPGHNPYPQTGGYPSMGPNPSTGPYVAPSVPNQYQPPGAYPPNPGYPGGPTNPSYPSYPGSNTGGYPPY